MVRIHKYQNEKGATMLEFAMVGSLVIGLLGVVFDLGIGLHHYSILTKVTTTAARDMAGVISEGECSAIEENIINRAERELAQQNISTEMATRVTFDPDFTGLGADEPPILRLRGNWELTCFFCMLTPRGLSISNTSEALIEDTQFTCF